MQTTAKPQHQPENAWDALREIAKDPTLNARRPNVGTTVRVIEGKRMGETGTVTWHGIDKFNRTAWRCADMQAQLRDLRGQWGYRVRVQPEAGESFFIGAEKVCVL
jgi:hypothetical protein